MLSNLGKKSRLVYSIWASNPDLTNYLFRCKVRAWLENGQDVDKADSYGNTGLLLAAEKGLVEVKIHYFLFLAKLKLRYLQMCKLLLCHGADPNHANSAVGWTALHYAAYQGHPSVVCKQNILWLPAIQITLGVSLLRMISKSYAFEHPQHFLWLCAVYRNGLFYCF